MTTRSLADTQIEIVRDLPVRGHARFALFDFDGTISLLREGWQKVMIPMMVEILSSLQTGETESELTSAVTDYVDLLTGQQTIYQMIRLVEEVKKHGGTPLEPLAYKQIYHDRLLSHISGRLSALKDGSIPPSHFVVPGVFEFLENLRGKGVSLYLASGTDEAYVRDEVDALGVSNIFDGGIYGAHDDFEKFSKKMLIEEILRKHNMSGSGLVVFGDGYVEIHDAKEAGGIAVGVASDEVNREGIDAWKRKRLIDAGADIIVPDYREQDTLVAYLFGELP